MTRSLLLFSVAFLPAFAVNLIGAEAGGVVSSGIERAKIRFQEIRKREEEIREHRKVIASAFQNGAGDLFSQRNVRIRKNGAIVSGGLLVHSERGWVVFPLDAVGEADSEVEVLLAGGATYRCKWQMLSEPHNLALVCLADVGAYKPPFPENRLEACRECDADVGSIVGLLQNQGSWLTGAVTGRAHCDESNLSPDLLASVSFHQKRMKTRVSLRRTGFADAITVDLPISPTECGAGVVSLRGSFIGIAVARTDVQETVVIPANILTELIKTIES